MNSDNMKAIVCTKYGPPEVLQLKEVSKPEPKDDEVLIKIFATAVTASDIFVRGSQFPVKFWILMRLAIGLTKPRRSIIGEVLSGQIKPVIDRIYPLEQIVEAHTYVGKGHKKGGVVITISHNSR